MRNCFLLILLFIGFTASSQDMDADQNPNYKISQKKYTKLKDSLLMNSNTTVQQTYKAYDWYEAREERRAERRKSRNMMRSYNRYSNPYNSYYPYYNNFGYPSYSPWNNFMRYRPYIGYRTGDWWFGF